MDNETLEAFVKVSEQIVALANKEDDFKGAYCQIGASMQTILDAVTNGFVNGNVTKESAESQRLAVLIAAQLADMTSEKYKEQYNM